MTNNIQLKVSNITTQFVEDTAVRCDVRFELFDYDFSVNTRIPLLPSDLQEGQSLDSMTKNEIREAALQKYMKLVNGELPIPE